MLFDFNQRYTIWKDEQNKTLVHENQAMRLGFSD